MVIKEGNMKTFKRIIAVALLIVAVIVVGYLCYTGSRLTAIQESAEVCYEQTI